MLSKVFSRMFSTAPNVWVNKHTKVICQGITGNQVLIASCRELSKLSRPSIMEHKWSAEWTQKKLDLFILDFQFSRIACRPKRQLDATLQSFMFLLQEQLMRSLRLSKLNWICALLLLTVFPYLFRYPPTWHD